MARWQLRNLATWQRFRLGTAGWMLLFTATVACTASAQLADSRLPDRLSDAEFWALVDSISEPGGYFQIQDNFTSNEREIGQIFTMLRERGTRGGAYIGVGPEQNLTYIASIRPQMAFVIDIRRQAVMQHLMYKAVFEMSQDRAQFISMLFSKPRPAGLDSSSSIQAIWEAFWPVASDSALYKANYARIVELLTKTHGFRFTPDEMQSLKWVYDNFFAWGPSITTRAGSGGGGGGGNQSTFADLTGYSTDASGTARSFLSSEENYLFVKNLQARNLVIPVSGDFAGPKALRAIGSYLKDHGGTVSAFYVSNVEQYLIRDGKAAAFYENVATLPVNDASVFIRPFSLRRYGFSMQPLCPIGAFIAATRTNAPLMTVGSVSCPG